MRFRLPGLRGPAALVVATPENRLRAATMPPWAPLATHFGESNFDLEKGARVGRAQLLLEGVLDDARDGRPPQLLGVREPHVDDCEMAAEPWPVLLEPVEDGVVGQHDSERRQALVEVVEVIDEGTHLVIPNSVPTRPSGLPSSACRESCERGCRRLNNEGPVDGRDHVRSMMVGLREVKGPSNCPQGRCVYPYRASRYRKSRFKLGPHDRSDARTATTGVSDREASVVLECASARRRCRRLAHAMRSTRVHSKGRRHDPQRLRASHRLLPRSQRYSIPIGS